MHTNQIGCFDMGDIFGDGSGDEKSVHKVCVSDFYLGRTEVTQKQWVDMMGHNPSKFKCGDCPVERVSWNNVQDFLKRLDKVTGMNYRLPAVDCNDFVPDSKKFANIGFRLARSP